MVHIRRTTAILIALALAAVLAACAGRAAPAEPVATATLSGTSALIDTDWALISLQGQPLLPATQIALRFEGDRFVSFAGCNTLGGKYAAPESGALSHPELELTMELCPEPEGVMEQERAYVDAFAGTTSYLLSENRLELQDAAGKTVLVYERVPQATTGSILPGTKWVLSSLRGQPLLPGTVINLEFGAQSLSGYAGCNFYDGGFGSGQPGATGDGTLAIRSFEITARECREGAGAQEQEKAYLEALTNSVSFRIAADRLELQDAAGETVLVYARRAACAGEPASLAGTAWQLVSVDGREPAEGSATSLAFLDDKWFAEFSQCEGHISSYQTIGHDLSAGFSAGLGRVCPDEQGHGVTLLEAPADYCLSQGGLDITTVPGQVFAYEPLPGAAYLDLEGPAWSLLSIVAARQVEGQTVPWPDPARVTEGTEVTVALEAGTASGSAGCNDYGAAYALEGSSLTFGEIVTTERDCSTPEGVMEQEVRYRELLAAVASHHIYGNLLWLETGDGRALAFLATEG